MIMRVIINHVSNGFVISYQSGLIEDLKDNTKEIYTDGREAFNAARDWFNKLLK